MSKHIRKTCLRSVALEVEDTALIWMLTSAKKKQKQNVPVNAKCYPKEIMSSRCLLFIQVYIPIIFLQSLVHLVTASHNHIKGK